jgi:phosphoglycolate phosphatase-like HAD superfamily hydrolase
MLDVREHLAGWTSSADVDMAKPEPDVVLVAKKKGGGGPAVMIGDSTWDCEAAERAGVPSIGVLTGGFSERELRNAGAFRVFESVKQLTKHLDEIEGFVSA